VRAEGGAPYGFAFRCHPEEAVCADEGSPFGMLVWVAVVSYHRQKEILRSRQEASLPQDDRPGRHSEAFQAAMAESE
jgi:hypothetical protein